MLTESTEMYLLTIYRLTERCEYATISQISASMQIGLPSVSEKIKRLTNDGLLEHEYREGVSLSERGRMVALKMLRKRRLIETFLVKMAAYGMDEVHEEACRLEHVISDRLADQLEKMLNYPKLDPHGHSIPDAEGKMPGEDAIPLSAVTVGQKVKVTRLFTADIAQVKYINQTGMSPGAIGTVVESVPFDDLIVVQVGEKQLPMSKKTASVIGMMLLTN